MSAAKKKATPPKKPAKAPPAKKPVKAPPPKGAVKRKKKGRNYGLRSRFDRARSAFTKELAAVDDAVFRAHRMLHVGMDGDEETSRADMSAPSEVRLYLCVHNAYASLSAAWLTPVLSEFDHKLVELGQMPTPWPAPSPRRDPAAPEEIGIPLSQAHQWLHAALTLLHTGACCEAEHTTRVDLEASMAALLLARDAWHYLGRVLQTDAMKACAARLEPHFALARTIVEKILPRPQPTSLAGQVFGTRPTGTE